MFQPGLVSISFRGHSVEEILSQAQAAGLKSIEWGSDVHAPREDPERLRRIAELQRQADITCCSYGTYFRLGFTPMEELESYLLAAKCLGTRVVRLWAGRKQACDCTPEERARMIDLCRQAAEIARRHDAVLCLECHRRSYTQTWEGALELMEAVDSPHLRMYWQPNPDLTLEENLLYLQKLRSYTVHVHVFHWVGDVRHPLAQGVEVWRQYLSQLEGCHHLLLEFMPDDQIRSLRAEAAALHRLIQES